MPDRIAPHAARWDKAHHFPAAELQGLAGLGCYGVWFRPSTTALGSITWR